MKIVTYTDEKGRNYQAYEDDDRQKVIIGPPEGLVDALGLPEPFATRLHNALHGRNILNYQQAAKNPSDLVGALQESFSLDVQMLLEQYHQYSG
jgi:ATP phosphoribosyltransferase regulatory subunit HisZ